MTTQKEALRMAVAALKKSKDALAEELAAWDIHPPLHHVLEAHDACEQTIKACEEALAQPANKPIKLKPGDVLVESSVIRRGGFILKTSQGVRLTHRPTGRVIEVCEERSQHRNRAIAWEMLERLVAQEQQEPEPVGEFVKADYGDYPVLKWNENYLAKIGDKFYTHPKEWQAKRVESQTVERAMLAAANGLRIIDKESKA